MEHKIGEEKGRYVGQGGVGTGGVLEGRAWRHGRREEGYVCTYGEGVGEVDGMESMWGRVEEGQVENKDVEGC